MFGVFPLLLSLPELFAFGSLERFASLVAKLLDSSAISCRPLGVLVVTPRCRPASFSFVLELGIRRPSVIIGWALLGLILLGMLLSLVRHGRPPTV
jgi:hypothetical protein